MALLDVEAGQVVREAWIDDPVLEPPRSDREATAPSFIHGEWWVPTRAALYTVDAHSLVATRRISHPLLTDIHSVSARSAGGCWVTSTGIDAVLALGWDGELLERRDLGTPREGLDYRGLSYRALKPHEVHPNQATEWGGGLWVTRFEQRDALCDDGRRVPLPEGPPHDGHLREGLVWFTTVTGHVIAVDPETLERREHYDLGALSDSRRALGWCRGIEVVGDRVFVGMTQLRKSAHVELMRWVVRGEAGRLEPTRVVELSRASGRIVQEIEVGNRAGGTIHGLLAVTPRGE